MILFIGVKWYIWNYCTSCALLCFSDGTARGGEGPGEADFTRSTGELQFKHGETSKYITVDCNKDTKVCINMAIKYSMVILKIELKITKMGYIGI